MAEPKPPTGEELAAIRANVELEASPCARRVRNGCFPDLAPLLDELRAALGEGKG